MLQRARGLATFAGVWVDPFRSELHVAVTDDVGGALATLKPLLPKGQTLYVHRFRYPMSELMSIMDRLGADHDELTNDGYYMSSWGTDEKNNCVLVTIDPLNERVVAELRSRYGEPIAFGYAARPAPIPSSWPTDPELIEAVEAAIEGEELVTCGGEPFPASVLDEPDVEDVPADLADAVRAAAAFWESEFGDLDGMDWRLAYRDEDSAMFIAKSTYGGWVALGLNRDAQGWRPGGIGHCQPRGAGIAGAGQASWQLDPDYDSPTSDSIELHVLITEFACSGGIPAFGRLVPPEVAYESDSLTMTVGVTPVSGGATCPGNPPTQATVVLPRPLGNRAVLDGSKHPPAPPDDSDL